MLCGLASLACSKSYIVLCILVRCELLICFASFLKFEANERRNISVQPFKSFFGFALLSKKPYIDSLIVATSSILPSLF